MAECLSNNSLDNIEDCTASVTQEPLNEEVVFEFVAEVDIKQECTNDALDTSELEVISTIDDDVPGDFVHQTSEKGNVEANSCTGEQSVDSVIDDITDCNDASDRQSENALNKRSLAARRLIKSGVKQYKCFHCEKSFTQSSNLSKHVLIHTGLKPFKCPNCEKSFTQATHLAKHILLHNGVKQFQCSDCEKAFYRNNDLTRHRLIHSDVGDRPFKCPNCAKSFTVRSYLTQHILIHTGIERTTCGFCGNTYAHKRNLTAHIRSTHVD